MARLPPRSQPPTRDFNFSEWILRFTLAGPRSTFSRKIGCVDVREMHLYIGNSVDIRICVLKEKGSLITTYHHHHRTITTTTATIITTTTTTTAKNKKIIKAVAILLLTLSSTN